MQLHHTTHLYRIGTDEFADALQSLGLPAPAPGERLDYRVEGFILSVSADEACRPDGDAVVRASVRRYHL